MQAAALQMTSNIDVISNLAQAENLLTQAAAQGATLAVLPENFALLGQGPEFKKIRLTIQETLGQGLIQGFLADISKRLGLWIIAGTMPIKSTDSVRPYAACLVFNDKGERIAQYNKINLFDVALSESEVYRESDSIMPGTDAIVVQTPIGRVGLSVCYDLRFPDLYRSLVEKGAEILVVPAAFTKTTGEMHWEVLTRALAIQQFCYVIAPAQTGVHGMGRKTFGHSVIVSPKGEVLAQLHNEIGVIVAELDLKELAVYRKKFLFQV
ncbi:MAG: carbon-nitrogen hydrolase family protein [Legionellales bacterium]|jgi:nitrilase